MAKKDGVSEAKAVWERAAQVLDDLRARKHAAAARITELSEEIRAAQQSGGVPLDTDPAGNIAVAVPVTLETLRADLATARAERDATEAAIEAQQERVSYARRAYGNAVQAADAGDYAAELQRLADALATAGKAAGAVQAFHERWNEARGGYAAGGPVTVTEFLLTRRGNTINKALAQLEAAGAEVGVAHADDGSVARAGPR